MFDVQASVAEAHVQMKMKSVALELQEREQEVFGALVFSSEERGPVRFFNTVRQHVDALAFMAQFPDIPVSGIFVPAQIGPRATYRDGDDEEQDNENTNNVTTQQGTIQDDQCRSYGWQMFTAMFILFVKPKRSTSSSALLKTLGTEGLAAAVRHVLDRRRGGGEPVVGRASVVG